MKRPVTRVLILTLVCAGTSLWAHADGPAPQAEGPYSQRKPSPDGIGKVYMGREIALVMGHQGASWLDRPGREREERTDEVIDALELKPSDVVADVGTGTGYFAIRIAKRLPEGRVLAVDIQQEMLDHLVFRAGLAGVENITPVLGTVSDPELPEGGVDLALLVDAYHEFSYPREMMQAIARALRPGGRVVLVEYRGEDPKIRIKPLHKMTEAQVRKELEAAGLAFRSNGRFLPTQHFLVFERPK